MKGESILVTGGAGSFGKAFVRYALDHDAKRIRVFSRGEHRQADMREQFDDDRLGFFIGDVRDRDRLRRAMEGCSLVIHAAALKRIEVGALDPIEMVRTNIDGAINVIEAAMDAGVERVVGLSTDKAYQARSPYGQSKALAEALFINANNMTGSLGPRFAVTRYGNISGSEGSVIPKWRALIANGDTCVPVTDPEATRFWMTLQEGVELVANTARTMHGGELVIPSTLPAYRVADLAEAMGVEMNIIGLPAFEKLHEGMRDGLTSDIVRRMSVQELKKALQNV